MTENEALGYLKNSKRQKSILGILPGSDIGNTIIKALEELKQYRAIGTLEECRAAMEKQTAKKVKSISQVKDGDSYVGLIGRCPCCGDILENEIDQTGMGKAFFFSTKGDVDAIDFIKNHIRYAYYAEYYDGFQAPFTVCAWNGTVDFLIELAKNTELLSTHKYDKLKFSEGVSAYGKV